MKINFKSLSLGLIIGVAITSGVVYAATLINSSDITYSPEDSSWDVSNVKDALDDMYTIITDDTIKNDLIVANWLNEKYTTSSSWTIFEPTVFDENFFMNSNGTLTTLKGGNYRIYYQSAYDGGTDGMGYIRILINGASVASCGNHYARCDNALIYYDTTLNTNDTITVQGYSTKTTWGSRVVASIVRLKDV